MDKKDLLGLEIKAVMEADTMGMELSSKTIQNIMNTRKRTWRDNLKDFLNKEIEIPLAPALVGFAALLAITSIPKDIFTNQNIKIIDIGSSQMIIREKEVSRR